MKAERILQEAVASLDSDKPEFEQLINKVHCMDVLEGLRLMPDKCVNLFIIDPPYFKVKGDFDFKLTWKEWQQLHQDLAKECKRVMTENGTLFLYGDRLNIAYQQVIFDQYFTLENHLCIQKASESMVERFTTLRSFPERFFERCLMYSTGNEPGEWELTGWEKIQEEKIKPRHPFALYLRQEFEKACVTAKELAALFPSRTGGLTGCVSNWLNGENVITEEQYLKIREYLNNQFLQKPYEELRRPFDNFLKLSDHWYFTNEGEHREIDHPTQKSLQQSRVMILSCSRKGDLVCAPFAGSGTECAMAAKEGRKFVGFDIEPKYVKMANDRCKPHVERKQLSILDFVE